MAALLVPPRCGSGETPRGLHPLSLQYDTEYLVVGQEVLTPQQQLDSLTFGRPEACTMIWWNENGNTWERRNALVQLAKGPFARGSTRFCFRLLELDEQTQQMMQLAASTGSSSGRGNLHHPPRELVAKFFDPMALQKKFGGLEISKQVYLDEAESLKVGAKFAVEFNKLNPVNEISFCAPIVMELDERPGRPMCGVEPLLEGEFQKHNNNFGGVLSSRSTPQAFSHFTLQSSGGEMLVCDIQGTKNVFTDPQVHTRSGIGYGLGNKGEGGIERFLKSHTCGPMCAVIGLPRLKKGKLVDDWTEIERKIGLSELINGRAQSGSHSGSGSTSPRRGGGIPSLPPLPPKIPAHPLAILHSSSSSNSHHHRNSQQQQHQQQQQQQQRGLGHHQQQQLQAPNSASKGSRPHSAGIMMANGFQPSSQQLQQQQLQPPFLKSEVSRSNRGELTTTSKNAFARSHSAPDAGSESEGTTTSSSMSGSVIGMPSGGESSSSSAGTNTGTSISTTSGGGTGDEGDDNNSSNNNSLVNNTVRINIGSMSKVNNVQGRKKEKSGSTTSKAVMAQLLDLQRQQISSLKEVARRKDHEVTFLRERVQSLSSAAAASNNGGLGGRSASPTGALIVSSASVTMPAIQQPGSSPTPSWTTNTGDGSNGAATATMLLIKERALEAQTKALDSTRELLDRRLEQLSRHEAVLQQMRRELQMSLSSPAQSFLEKLGSVDRDAEVGRLRHQLEILDGQLKLQMADREQKMTLEAQRIKETSLREMAFKDRIHEMQRQLACATAELNEQQLQIKVLNMQSQATKMQSETEEAELLPLRQTIADLRKQQEIQFERHRKEKEQMEAQFVADKDMAVAEARVALTATLKEEHKKEIDQLRTEYLQQRDAFLSEKAASAVQEKKKQEKEEETLILAESVLKAHEWIVIAGSGAERKEIEVEIEMLRELQREWPQDAASKFAETTTEKFRNMHAEVLAGAVAGRLMLLGELMEFERKIVSMEQCMQEKHNRELETMHENASREIEKLHDSHSAAIDALKKQLEEVLSGASATAIKFDNSTQMPERAAELVSVDVNTDLTVAAMMLRDKELDARKAQLKIEADHIKKYNSQIEQREAAVSADFSRYHKMMEELEARRSALTTLEIEVDKRSASLLQREEEMGKWSKRLSKRESEVAETEQALVEASKSDRKLIHELEEKAERAVAAKSQAEIELNLLRKQLEHQRKMSDALQQEIAASRDFPGSGSSKNIFLQQKQLQQFSPRSTDASSAVAPESASQTPTSAAAAANKIDNVPTTTATTTTATATTTTTTNPSAPPPPAASSAPPVTIPAASHHPPPLSLPTRSSSSSNLLFAAPPPAPSTLPQPSPRVPTASSSTASTSTLFPTTSISASAYPLPSSSSSTASSSTQFLTSSSVIGSNNISNSNFINNSSNFNQFMMGSSNISSSSSVMRPSSILSRSLDFANSFPSRVLSDPIPIERVQYSSTTSSSSFANQPSSSAMALVSSPRRHHHPRDLYPSTNPTASASVPKESIPVFRC